jgi:nitronate monooxygenase
VLAGSDGDATTRTTVPDKARGLPWPDEFTIRVWENAYIRHWSGREDELATAVETERPRYYEALARGAVDETGVLFGEAAGLIDAVRPAGAIVEAMVAEAIAAIGRSAATIRD